MEQDIDVLSKQWKDLIIESKLIIFDLIRDILYSKNDEDFIKAICNYDELTYNLSIESLKKELKEKELKEDNNE